MSPKEFLTYVLKELTLEERESLMVDERQRRKTFLVNWPYDDQRSGVKMAQAGFYSLNCADRVQCVFCRGSLHQWSSNEIPMDEHRKHFSFCRFVKGLQCGNRECRENTLLNEDFKNITTFSKSDTTSSRAYGISTRNLPFAPAAFRMCTFAGWPASRPITAQRMCEAGFYFTGVEDQVRCFFCAGGVKHWRENDDPWEEHARWFPDCPFLLQQKGQRYVEEVHHTMETNPTKRKTIKVKPRRNERIVRKQKTTAFNKIKADVNEASANSSTTTNHTNNFLNQNQSQPVSFWQLGIQTNRPIDTSHALRSSRLATFTHWPQSCPIAPGKLSEAGFCYTGKEDEVRCFFCNIGVAKWQKDDDPWKEHALYNPDCKFLREQKGWIYIKQVLDNAPGYMNVNRKRFEPPADLPQVQVREKRSNLLICLICEQNHSVHVPATNVTLPCGHLVFCNDCTRKSEAQSVEHPIICPECGAELSGAIRVYI
ncbi:XIAP [Bugula neritina]|uniref:XIAP n=1 Tax=Bugula neritina TaxID=10212 RepID=A0A7J7JT17_BUGNE|nr:XIAP [Bugula neritina]